MKTVFSKIFGEEKVVGVRVLPKLDDVYKKAQKLRVKRERYAYFKHHNDKNGGTKRETIVRGKVGCFRKGEKLDAEQYYHQKCLKYAKELRTEKELRDSFNSGIGYVTFTSRL